MNEKNAYAPIDLAEPFYGFETPPRSFLKDCEKYWCQYWRDREKQYTDADKAFYGIEEDGQECFYIGNTRIRITEHFPKTGADMRELMAKMILSAARHLDGSN